MCKCSKTLTTAKVLVVCPVYDGKMYVFPRWIEMVKSLTYPNYDVLVIDNSETDSLYDLCSGEIPIQKLKNRPADSLLRITKSMAQAREVFLAKDYDYWMNIEADNIPPHNIIETLMPFAVDGADWVCHTYPHSSTVKSLLFGVGCSLFSRRLITDFEWGSENQPYAPDNELFTWLTDKPQYKSIFLANYADVQHIK